MEAFSKEWSEKNKTIVDFQATAVQIE